MGIKDFMRNTVLRMDMLSANPTFRTRRQTQYETLLGGVLSFGIMVAFAYILYIQLADMFNKLTISYEQGLSDDLSSSNSLSDIRFAVSIDGVDLSASAKKFRFLMEQVELGPIVNGTPTFKRSPIILSPCTAADWSTLGTTFQTQFSAFGFDKMLCIPRNQSYQVAGYIGSPVYKYLSFQIVQCNKTLDSSCQDLTSINTYIANFLTKSDYFNVRFFLVDTIITPSNQNAITQILEKNIFMAFTKTVGTVGYINMAQYTLQTDENYWPTTTYTEVTGSYIDSFQTNSVSISSTKYVSVNIYKSTKSLTITRTLGKIDSVLSYVGGLFGLLFTGIAFFLASYSDISYEIHVADSMLTLDKTGRRLKENDFWFHTYIAYKIYDWMDAFGIAPSCFKKMDDIHKVREEVCEQLDAVLILKRIKHLEDVSQILLSEHREMCMYLTEPMTLAQARHMRHALTYYDKLLGDIEVSRGKDRRGDPNEQKYIDPHMPSNSFESLQQIQMIKSQPDIERADQTESEQEERIVKMLKQTIKSLERDTSHIGTRIKERISPETRRWILQLPPEEPPAAQQGITINIY